MLTEKSIFVPLNSSLYGWVGVTKGAVFYENKVINMTVKCYNLYYNCKNLSKAETSSRSQWRQKICRVQNAYICFNYKLGGIKQVELELTCWRQTELVRLPAGTLGTREHTVIYQSSLTDYKTFSSTITKMLLRASVLFQQTQALFQQIYCTFENIQPYDVTAVKST